MRCNVAHTFFINETTLLGNMGGVGDEMTLGTAVTTGSLDNRHGTPLVVAKGRLSVLVQVSRQSCQNLRLKIK